MKPCFCPILLKMCPWKKNVLQIGVFKMTNTLYYFQTKNLRWISWHYKLCLCDHNACIHAMLGAFFARPYLLPPPCGPVLTLIVLNFLAVTAAVRHLSRLCCWNALTLGPAPTRPQTRKLAVWAVLMAISLTSWYVQVYVVTVDTGVLWLNVILMSWMFKWLESCVVCFDFTTFNFH